MNITATQINYYHVCHRKLWLFSNGITMEHNSEAVAEGKFIGETSYTQRATKYKEIQIGPIKLDHYDAVNKIVREIKKSDKLEESHIMQVKYYLFVLELNEILECTGLIEYPKLKHTTEVFLEEEDRIYFKKHLAIISELILNETCPPIINKPYCKKCAYYEFCFATE
jgi:CRISPR-associated exonuclease Cas4